MCHCPPALIISGGHGGEGGKTVISTMVFVQGSGAKAFEITMSQACQHYVCAGCHPVAHATVAA